MAKIDFLVTAVFFVSLILIANAAEENTSESYNTTNEMPFLNHSNNTATNDTYGLNGTDAAIGTQSNESTEISNSAEDTAQNNLSNVNKTNNANLSDALIAENMNIGAEETRNNSNEIMVEPSQATTDNISSAVVESEKEETTTSVTASFGVYLEIVG